MAGFLAYMAAGAAEGAGKGIVEEARSLKEQRMRELERDYQRQERLSGQEFQASENEKSRQFQKENAQGEMVDLGGGKYGVRKGTRVEPLTDAEGNPISIETKPGYRQLTPEEVTERNLDPAKSYQMNKEGKIEQIGGGGVTVNTGDGMKLTEAQSKDVGFYARGKYALNDLEQLDKQLTSASGFMASKGGTLGNYFKDPEYQMAEGAGKDFLAIILRKDTGAAVTPQEFELYGQTYLPWPGDDTKTIAAKRDRRERALKALRRGLGTASPMADDIDRQFEAEMAGDMSGSPAVGDVVDGYRFKGGDPASPSSWEKVN
jgi:hypothetical protein